MGVLLVVGVGVGSARRAGRWRVRGGTGSSGRSSASTRRRRRAAKSGSGVAGASGRRRASKGSATVVTSFGVGGWGRWVGRVVVGGPEGLAGPDEQRLGGVHGAAQVDGHLGHGQAVEVAKGQ